MTDFKDIKLIALDLDDTTLRSDATLAEETAEAIKNAIANGIEVVVASGRAFRSLPQSVLSIEGIRYAISSNGAAIEQVSDGSRIMSFMLKDTAVNKILEVFEGERFEAFISGQPYCDSEYIADPVRFGCSEAYIDYVKTTRLPVDDMPGFIRQNIDRLDSIDVLCGTVEHKNSLWEKAKLVDDVYITSSSPRLLEISDSRAGKGAALRYLADYLNVKHEHIAAFGNGDNDADMLKFAGLGVAVKNASSACLEAADYICETNNDLGVAKTIMKMI